MKIWKRLKVYYPFMENDLKSNLAYKGSFYLFMFCSVFGAFISYYLWMAIYGSSKTGVLGGLTQKEMVTYIFMTYVTANTAKLSLSNLISNDVREGTVAMTLIKPIDYRMSLISRAVGGAIYRFIAPSVWIWIGLEVYRCVVLKEQMTPIINMVIYLISVMFSFLLYVLYNFCFGMIAFTNTYMFGVKRIEEAIFLFLSGELIPISFFPDVIQNVFEYLPFSSMIYTPVMIYMGKYSINQLVFAISRQFIWIIILYFLGSFLWKKITKRLIVLGG